MRTNLKKQNIIDNLNWLLYSDMTRKEKVAVFIDIQNNLDKCIIALDQPDFCEYIKTVDRLPFMEVAEHV